MTERLIAEIEKNSREQLRITLGEFKGHRLVDLRVWFRADDVTMRPGAFAFGRARGAVEGVLSLTWLAAPSWRRAVGPPVNASRDGARSEAIRRCPAHAELFARAKNDGRAEAALIGVAGLLREGAL
jgi:hypothetical protein